MDPEILIYGRLCFVVSMSKHPSLDSFLSIIQEVKSLVGNMNFELLLVFTFSLISGNIVNPCYTILFTIQYAFQYRFSIPYIYNNWKLTGQTEGRYRKQGSGIKSYDVECGPSGIIHCQVS